MGLRALLKRLKARFRPSAPVPAPEDRRAVPCLELLETWEGVSDEAVGEVLDSMMQEFEEDMAEMQDAFRGQN